MSNNTIEISLYYIHNNISPISIFFLKYVNNYIKIIINYLHEIIIKLEDIENLELLNNIYLISKNTAQKQEILYDYPFNSLNDINEIQLCITTFIKNSKYPILIPNNYDNMPNNTTENYYDFEHIFTNI